MKFRPAALVAISSIIGACEYPSEITTLAPLANDQQGSQAVNSQELDHYFEPAFEIDVTVGGSLAPGQPVQIVGRVRATRALVATQIDLYTPEIDFAEQTGWTDFRIKSGVPLTPRSSAVGQMSPAIAKVLHATVVPQKPGYYRVLVIAKTSSVSDPTVAKHISKEIWLWIDTNAGRVTKAFDPLLFPSNAVVRGGPLLFRNRRPNGAERTTASVVSTSSTASMIDGYRYEVKYLNENVYPARFDPIPSVDLAYTITDVYENRTWGPFILTADAAGIVEIPCPQSSEQFDGEVRISTNDFWIARANGGFAGGYWDCGQTSDIVIHGHSAYTYLNMRDHIIPKSRNLLGYSRGNIKVIADNTGNDGTYQPVGDSLRLSGAWGEDGLRHQSHEYGHAVHYKALGFDSTAYSGSCTNDKDAQSPTMSCGYVEGFAQFHAAASLGSSLVPTIYNWLESNSGLNAGEDGSRVPNAVAAFLLDLVDTNNEAAHDQSSWPGSYVANILKTCSSKVSGAWVTPDGIDQIIWCMENTVDSAITGNSSYFGLRSPDPTDQSNGAGLPGGLTATQVKTVVRANWLKNLYGQ